MTGIDFFYLVVTFYLFRTLMLKQKKADLEFCKSHTKQTIHEKEYRNTNSTFNCFA